MISEYDPKLFEGTARYYARYRFPYQKELFEYILKTASSLERSWALDVGCGTGQLAIPLSSHFKKIVCMDPDSEMLSELRRIAEEGSIVNMETLQASSWDLDTLSPASFQLVTPGESFHWMDRYQVLQDIHDILIENGLLVIVTRKLRYPSGVQNAIDSVIEQFIGEKRRAGIGFYKHPEERSESVLDKSPLHSLERWIHSYRLPSTIENTIGFLHSTSYAARRLLGNDVDAFDDQIRRQIASILGKEDFDVSITTTALCARKSVP